MAPKSFKDAKDVPTLSIFSYRFLTCITLTCLHIMNLVQSVTEGADPLHSISFAQLVVKGRVLNTNSHQKTDSGHVIIRVTVMLQTQTAESG